MTQGSSGLDLCSAEHEPIAISPGETKLVSTGLQIGIPEGYEAQIRPRSGMALKHGITMLNTPGTIDSDYRGTIKLIAVNLGKEKFVIEPGMRVAQMVFQKVIQADFQEVIELDDTTRSVGGFGHTGH